MSSKGYTAIKRYSKSVITQFALAWGIIIAITVPLCLMEGSFDYFLPSILWEYIQITEKAILIILQRRIPGDLYDIIQVWSIITRALATFCIAILSLKRPLKTALIAESIITLLSIGLFIIESLQ